MKKNAIKVKRREGYRKKKKEYSKKKRRRNIEGKMLKTEERSQKK